LQLVIKTKQNKAMQYHLIVMVLAEYSSSYSLFACHMMLATSILTLLKLSNISKPLCSSLMLAPQCPAGLYDNHNLSFIKIIVIVSHATH